MSNKWKGVDISLSESVNEFGMVYMYDGDNFNGYCAIGYNDDDGLPNEFATFALDNQSVDDYFEDDGDDIAKMCGVSQDEMDYEWKMDALFAYYGANEFVNFYNGLTLTTDEVISKVKDNWFGNVDC